jgi:sigma-E factor negative regulatory protein RseA
MIEKISRFLDDDLSHDETLHLLQTIQDQPELKNTLKRYAAVSHAIKNDDFLWIPTDFASRIQQTIHQTSEDESTYQATDSYSLQ